MMPLRYCEERATQAAARFLHLRGGTMSYMKLVKLMYLADRKALVDLGRPITYDHFVSMEHGPVLSRTLDVVKGTTEAPYWRAHISPVDDYEVHLLTPQPPRDKLSRAEESIVDAVFADYGNFGRYALRDLTHTFPEWHDPHGSSEPIALREMLIGQGVSEEDAAKIEASLEDETALEALLAE